MSIIKKQKVWVDKDSYKRAGEALEALFFSKRNKKWKKI
jgi:hypothetical protein